MYGWVSTQLSFAVPRNPKLYAVCSDASYPSY